MTDGTLTMRHGIEVAYRDHSGSGHGYRAPNARRMAERSFVEHPNGTFRRHPARRLFEHAFADDSDLDRMNRHVRCPALLLRCTASGAPPVLDRGAGRTGGREPARRSAPGASRPTAAAST